MSLNLTEGMTVMKNTDSYNYGEMVAMSCKSGFIGTPVTSQCIDVNTWSHSPPICTGKDFIVGNIYTKLVDGEIKHASLSSYELFNLQNTYVTKLLEVLPYFVS